MKKRYTEEQIVKFIREYEQGSTVEELARKHGFSEQSFYRWKKKFGGMEISDVKKLKDLERENEKLKKLVADLSLDNQALKEVVSKKW